MKLSKLSAFFLCVLLTIWGFFFLPGQISYEGSPVIANLPEPKIVIPATSSLPDAPSVNAKYACVTDAVSGRVLYGKDSKTKAAMASTTKIMTAILVLESEKQSDIVTASSYAASMPKVHLGMKKGYRYAMKDLLYSLMLESHNDTAVAIAEHMAGSVKDFSVLMNKKAQLLGMTSTHFVTPNGLDADGHYSTAEDMCRLATYAIKNREFCSLIQTKSYRFSDMSQKHSYCLTNRDSFLSYYDGALGIKTGFTSKAGYCFVGAAQRGNITLTSCVLASGWPPNKTYKWVDTRKLMDYGFANFTLTALPVQPLNQANIIVLEGKKETVSLKPITPPSVLLSRSDEIKVLYDIPETLYAPIRKESAIGTVSFYINNKLYKKERVFPSESIEKNNFSDTIEKVLHIWMEIFGF